MRIFCVVLSVLLLLGQAGFAKSQPIALKKGDRIVFLGDSITAQGGGPGGYVSLIKNSINAAHPDWGVEVISAGVSGNKVPNLQARLQTAVLDKQPTLVFIYIGINDVWHWKKDKEGNLNGGTPKDKFTAGLKDIIGQIQKAGGNAVLCTASVIGEKVDGTNERDKMLDEYCELSRKVAADTKVALVDLRKAFLDYLKIHNKENAPKGILTRDSVHLNAAGNKLVAEQMLKALGVPLAEAPVTPARK